MSKQPVRVLQVLPSLSLESGIARVAVAYWKHLDPQDVTVDFMVHRHWPHDFTDELRAAGCAVWTVADLKGGNVRALRRDLADFYAAGTGVMEGPANVGNAVGAGGEAGAVGAPYDVVHCHMPNAAFFHLKAARDAGVPVRIMHSHLAASSDKPLHRVRNAPLIALGKRYMTHAMACSQAAGEYLFGNGPFFLMRNGVEVARFAFRADVRKAKREELGISDDAKVVGCVGRLCRQKNYGLVLGLMERLAARVPNVQLVIAGSGPLSSELKAQAARLGICDSVRFLGVRDDAAQLYSAFDALVMPSLVEGLPMVGVEAQAAGLPCVFSANVTREAALTDSCAFVRLDADVDEWVSAIVDALATPRNACAVSQIVQAGYDIAAAADGLAAFYEKAASLNVPAHDGKVLNDDGEVPRASVPTHDGKAAGR